jgi:hypothetical protein
MSLIHQLTPVGGVILAAPMAATIEHAAQPEIRRLSFVPSPFAAAGNGPRSRLSEGAVSLIYNPLALAENQPHAIVALAVAGTLDWPDLDAALQVAFKLFGPSVELTAVFDFWAALPREVDLGHKASEGRLWRGRHQFRPRPHHRGLHGRLAGSHASVADPDPRRSPRGSWPPRRLTSAAPPDIRPANHPHPAATPPAAQPGQLAGLPI